MVTPRPEETREEYMGRCVPFLLNEDPSIEQDVAVVRCSTAFKVFEAEQGKEFDAIEIQTEQAKKQINAIIIAEKENFGRIIDKFTSEIFNQQLADLEIELSLQPRTLFEFGQSGAVQQVLKDNTKAITFELFDAIEKEASLLLTNYNLDNVPISNAKLKRDIKNLFDSKRSRLASQVITETTRTANRAIEFGYKQSGVITHKQWVAILDDKTSSICRAGNGEVREIGKPFSTGDYTAPFHINCRSKIQGLTISEVENN